MHGFCLFYSSFTSFKYENLEMLSVNPFLCNIIAC